MFPRTLSNSIRNDLGPESLYPNFTALVNKLDEKPKQLVDFLLATFQSVNWSKKYENHRFLLATRISSNIISGRLPFEETITCCTHIFKYYVKHEGLFSITDFIVTVENGERIFLSKLVLMKASSVLKDKFFKYPNLKNEPLREFATYLTSIAELLVLYCSMYSENDSELSNLETNAFQKILFQCVEWNCPILDKLQRIFAARVVDYTTASSVLAFSKQFNLKYLETVCRDFLSSAHFLVHYSNITKYDNYLYIQPTLEGSFEGIFYPFDLIGLNGRIVSSGYEGNLPVSVSRVFMTFQDESRLAVGYFIQPETVNMKWIQKHRRENREEKLDTAKVKSIASDGTVCLPGYNLAGILLHFSNVKQLELVNYHEISDNLLRALSIIDHLRCLDIRNYSGSFDALLPLISSRLPNLTSLVILKGYINIIPLSLLLQNGHISKLTLSDCSFKTNPELDPLKGLNAFSNLKELYLRNIGTKVADVQELLSFCTNLETLYIEFEINQKLVFPISIRTLQIPSSLLSLYVESDTFSLFEGLPNLKKLDLPKGVNNHIIKIILNYFRNNSFEIEISK